MYEVTFRACSRDSSAVVQKTVSVSSVDDLINEWDTFTEEITFRKWYDDNEYPDDLPEDWISEIN